MHVHVALHLTLADASHITTMTHSFDSGFASQWIQKPKPRTVVFQHRTKELKRADDFNLQQTFSSMAIWLACWGRSASASHFHKAVQQKSWQLFKNFRAAYILHSLANLP